MSSAALERARKWRAANPGRQSALARKWREANPAADREAKRRWRAAHPARERELERVWRAANIEKVREYKRKYQQLRRAALKTSVTNAPTAKQLRDLLAQPCYYCGGIATQIDHYTPLARGGTHTIENLRPACASCNHRKGAKLPILEWTW